MHAATYRADIDGLRALAVLAVVLFHLKASGFSGGFVGVDVFFVISGYLITGLILREIREDRFSASRFFLRRARRLFPALFAVLAATFVAAALLFAPLHLERLSASLLSALFFVANFHFWSSSNYFSIAAHLQPLLHSWSLSIEEQFYLVWPFFLVLAARSKRSWFLPASIAFLTLLSFALAEFWMGKDPIAVFFLTPFRIWEFTLGALLALKGPELSRQTWGVPWASEIGLACGLLLIGFPVVLLEENSRFPGLAALAPCLGAVLVLHFGQAGFLGRVLRFSPLVYLGRISYSLYLIHWPLIGFYQYQYPGRLDTFEGAALLLASVVLAVLSYHFIEQPFRRSGPATGGYRALRFNAACLVLALLLSAPAAHSWAYSGWTWRLPKDIRSVLIDPAEARQASWRNVKAASEKPAFRPGAMKVLVIGDSHGKDVANALLLNGGRFGSIDVILRHVDFHCQPVLADRRTVSDPQARKNARSCGAAVDALLADPLLGEADAIMISARWQPWATAYIQQTLAAIGQRSDARIIVFGGTAEFPDVPTALFRYGRLDGFSEQISRRRRAHVGRVNKRIERIVAREDALFLDKQSLVCDEESGLCDIFDSEGNLLFYDYGHWTLAGAAHFGRKLAASDRLSDLLRSGDHSRQGSEKAAQTKSGPPFASHWRP